MELGNISEINRIAESLRWRLIGYFKAGNLILKKIHYAGLFVRTIYLYRH